MTTSDSTTFTGRKAMQRAAAVWFALTLLGQGLFVAFILAFYYPSTLSGDAAAWNRKPLIEGYVAGDTAGNFGFAVHVMLAAAMFAAGWLQLIPSIRTKAPQIHRWSGRLFIALALVLALGGLGLVWLRGTWLTLTGAISISLNAVLIVASAVLAWRTALARDFAAHRRWALRCFILCGGVWFMRIGYVGWGASTGGLGIAKGMSGPFDLVWGFGCYLLPLGLLEAWLRAERSKTERSRYLAAAMAVLCGLVVAATSALAWIAMWSPYL